MKLAPETVRLRRVAKAYAAGEFSLREYRVARHEVINNFSVDCLGDDDTQRRDEGVVAVDDVPTRVHQRNPWVFTSAALGLFVVLLTVATQLQG